MSQMPFSTKLENIKVNPSGFRYYSELPENYRQATINDFTVNGKRKIGMIFLIRWWHNPNFFQICYVSHNLTSDILEPHLKDNRVYVEKEK